MCSTGWGWCCGGVCCKSGRVCVCVWGGTESWWCPTTSLSQLLQEDVLYAKWHAESGVEFAGSLNGTKVVNRYMGSRLLFFSPLGFDHNKCFTVYEVDGLDVCWAVIRDESFITMHHVPLYTIYQLYDRV